MTKEGDACGQLTDVSVQSVTSAEAAFLAKVMTDGKPDVTVLRAGWPDFLLTRSDGSIVAVEVKCGADVPSAKQRACFAALERVGLKVLVWNPVAPGIFTPWHRYEPLPSPRTARQPSTPPPREDRWIYESVARTPPKRAR
jgi:VRR-NUC domain-containing protein